MLAPEQPADWAQCLRTTPPTLGTPALQFKIHSRVSRSSIILSRNKGCTRRLRLMTTTADRALARPWLGEVVLVRTDGKVPAMELQGPPHLQQDLDTMLEVVELVHLKADRCLMVKDLERNSATSWVTIPMST